MTLSLRAGLALMATTAVLAGCSTAPTITVPNPLAAFNGVLAPSPRVAAPAAPTYTAAPGMYQQVSPAGYVSAAPAYTSAPAYGTTSYGTLGQGYSVAAPATTIDTGAYSLGVSAPSYPGVSATEVATMGAPSYSAATSFGAGTYSLGNTTTTVSSPSYSAGVPTLGTLAASAPSYSMAAPAMESASYVSDATTFGESAMAAPSYAQSYAGQSYGMVQPVRASGTTYDLTVPSAGAGTGSAAGLTVDTGYGTLAAPAPSMGGSFQVTAPASVTGGVATYSSPALPAPGF